DRGKPVPHSYAKLADDVAAAEARLRGWGVAAGARVGVYAPNSYNWLVYDLAMIAVGATSVPFTDDFAGKVDADLLARYDIALLLTTKNNARLFPEGAPGVAL